MALRRDVVTKFWYKNLIYSPVGKAAVVPLKTTDHVHYLDSGSRRDRARAAHALSYVPRASVHPKLDSAQVLHGRSAATGGPDVSPCRGGRLCSHHVPHREKVMIIAAR